MARQKVWVLGGGTLAAGLAVVAWLAARQTDPAPGPAPSPAPLAQGSLIPPVAATGPAVEVAPQVQPAPRFDVVRVARDGAALVAGNATPGAAVTLRVDGAVVAEVAADGAGQFVAMFALGYSDAAQVMTLESAGADGVVLVAEDSVLLTPRAAEVAEAPAAAPSVEAVAAAAPQPEAPATDATPDATTSLAADADATPEATAALAAETAAAPLTEAAAEGDRATPATAPAGEGAGQTGAAFETQTAATAGQATPDTGAQARASPLAPAADLADQAAGTETAAATHAEPTASAAAPETPVETAAADATRAATPDPAAPITTEATQTAEAPDATASAPTALLLGRDGSVRVLDRGPVVFDAVIVDTISYSDIGEVQIAGRASGRSDPANLRIYLDNRPIAAAQAASGDWTSDLPDVDPGIYTLRVDQVNAEGRVVSRFETPFQREAPEAVAAARAQTTEPQAETAAPASAAPPSATLITVQPGHTLWAISRDRYGMGERYVTIFNANRSQIRDPDLIYPGQIFTLPGE